MKRHSNVDAPEQVYLRTNMGYEKPEIKKIVEIESTDLMAGSVVDEAEVTSTGQEVIDLDFSSGEFNTEWE